MQSANVNPNLNLLDTSPVLQGGGVESASENCLAIGQNLADFEITGIIGEGGFGIVYLAFDHSLHRTVAIKEYMPQALARRGQERNIVVRALKHQETFNAGLKSYINEARLLAQFDHPALVKVYRFWEENSTAYMAMQFYDGDTLKHLIENRPQLLTQEWLKNMLSSILAALETLYSAQILHRDVSPENIIIQKNGSPVLLDFGSARQVLAGMPQSLTVVLKPSYAPIEQYADDDSMQQGPWTDIYALCAVIYKAITKKAPPSSVTRMINDPIETLVAAGHIGFNKEFLAAIDQGLQVLPKNRPQSITAFRALLGIEAPVLTLPSHAVPFPGTPQFVQPVDLAPSARGTASDYSETITVAFSSSKDAVGTHQPSATQVLLGREQAAKGLPSEGATENPTVTTVLSYPVSAQARRYVKHGLDGSGYGDNQGGKKSPSAIRMFADKVRWPYVAATILLLGAITGFVLPMLGGKTTLTNNPDPGSLKTTVLPGQAGAESKPVTQASAPVSNSTAIVDSTSGAAIASTATGNPPSPVDAVAVEKTAKDKEGETEQKIGSKSGLDAANKRDVVSAVRPQSAQASLKVDLTLDPEESIVSDASNTKQEVVATVAPLTGSVRLAIKPWGTLYINGSARGVSPPVKKLSLPEGKYRVKIKNPNFSDYATEIVVSKKTPVTIQHDFMPAESTIR